LAGSILRKRATDTYNFVPPRLKTVTTLPSEIRKPYSSSLHMPVLPGVHIPNGKKYLQSYFKL